MAVNHRGYNVDCIDSYVNTEETTTQTINGDIDFQGNNLLNAGNLFTADTVLFSNDGTLTGMTTVNDGTNDWITGTASTIEGTNSLYISNNGSTASYNTGVAQVSHIETDTFAIPSTAANVWVKIQWECVGESGSGDDEYDYGRAFMALSTFNPSAGTEITDAADRDRIGILKFQRNFGTREMYIFLTDAQLTKYKSQTCKVIFSWKNDSSAGSNPPMIIGSIEVAAGDALHNERCYFEAKLKLNDFALTADVERLVEFDNVLDDRNQNWDTTNFKYVASQNGIHQMEAAVTVSAGTAAKTQCRLYKNGLIIGVDSDESSISGASYPSRGVTIGLVIGDEVEVFAYSSVAATLLAAGIITFSVVGPINKG